MPKYQNVEVTENLSVAGTSSLGGISLTNGASIGGGLTVTDGGADVTGDSSVTGDLTVTGLLDTCVTSRTLYSLSILTDPETPVSYTWNPLVHGQLFLITSSSYKLGHANISLDGGYTPKEGDELRVMSKESGAETNGCTVYFDWLQPQDQYMSTANAKGVMRFDGTLWWWQPDLVIRPTNGYALSYRGSGRRNAESLAKTLHRYSELVVGRTFNLYGDVIIPRISYGGRSLAVAIERDGASDPGVVSINDCDKSSFFLSVVPTPITGVNNALPKIGTTSDYFYLGCKASSATTNTLLYYLQGDGSGSGSFPGPTGTYTNFWVLAVDNSSDEISVLSEDGSGNWAVHYYNGSTWAATAYTSGSMPNVNFVASNSADRAVVGTDDGRLIVFSNLLTASSTATEVYGTSTREWQMAVYGGTGTREFIVAVANDGYTWTKRGDILNLGNTGSENTSIQDVLPNTASSGTVSMSYIQSDHEILATYISAYAYGTVYTDAVYLLHTDNYGETWTAHTVPGEADFGGSYTPGTLISYEKPGHPYIYLIPKTETASNDSLPVFRMTL